MKKKITWIMLLALCLCFSACRPADMDETYEEFSAPQTYAEQETPEEQEPSFENDLSMEKETPTETKKEPPAEQEPTENETLAEQKPSTEQESTVEEETPAEKETPEKTEAQKSEKSTISIMGTPAQVTQEFLTERAELILHGRVKAKLGEVMLNPDGKRTDASGQKVANAQVTSYEVEVYTVYKGTYEKNTIIVKTTNGRNLSPDLILYGEDETTKLAMPLDRFDLTVGEECIMYLVNIKDRLPEDNGYFVNSGKAGYFKKEGNVFKNNGVLPLTNTLETLAKEHANTEAQN